MYEKKLKVEKVELVKKFIRSNNYCDHDNTLQMCVEAGINVNLPALVRFADKLSLLDSAEKTKLHFEKFEDDYPMLHAQAKFANNSGSAMTYDEVKRREQEITFELGALKIKENELLTELANLNTCIEDQH